MANGKRTHVVAVSLPKELFRDLEKLRARLFRKRSEIVKEAVRQYVERHRVEGGRGSGYGSRREHSTPYDDEPVTAADRAAIRRGEAEIRRGDYVTLEELNRRFRYVAPRRTKKRA